jgi:hypothetical protein
MVAESLASLTRRLGMGVVLSGAYLAVFHTVLDGQSETGAPRQQSKPTIGFVQNANEFDGAGCTLWLPDDQNHSAKRRVLVSDFDKRAIMNIDGRDTPLMLVESKERKGEPQKGDHSSFRYRGKGIEATIGYVVVGLCAPDDESCEVISYDASLTVTTRSGRRVLTAHGVCGS